MSEPIYPKSTVLSMSTVWPTSVKDDRTLEQYISFFVEREMSLVLPGWTYSYHVDLSDRTYGEFRDGSYSLRYTVEANPPTPHLTESPS